MPRTRKAKKEPPKHLVADAWRGNLDTFAPAASKHRWISYRWVDDLSKRLTTAIMHRGARVVVTAPPQHGKTEICSHWLPVWYLDMFPDKSVIHVSYSAERVRENSEKARNEFDGSNDLLWSRVDPNHATATDWRLVQYGGMRATGIGGGITGYGADLIVIDDPHKDWEEVQSPANRRKVVNWFNAVLYTRRAPDASIIVIQTRWNRGDLAGYLLSEHHDDWTELRYPAVAGENDLLGREPGEALCPERYDRDELERIKLAIGSHMFAGLYQQQPAPEEGAIIHRDWIRYYGGPTGVELPSNLQQWQSWDMTFSETKTGSFVVGQVWGCSGSRYYLLDQVRGRMEYLTTKRKLIELSKAWPQALEKLVEDKANGPAIISDLRASVPGLIAVNPKGSKIARLRAVSPLFEAGNVFVPHPTIAPWVADWVEEMVTFPGSDQDDQVDTTSQALARKRKAMIDISIPDSGQRVSPWAM